MPNQQEDVKGDRVRIIQGFLTASQGVEATVVKLYGDANNTTTTLDICIAPDPVHTYGTTVFPQEIELLSSSTHEE